MQFVNSIYIENKKIGLGSPVFIIAEIGVNHNGDFELAKQMIDVAKECGVDAVKFQTFKAEEFMADKEMQYTYEVDGHEVTENMFDMFKRLELPDEWHGKLFEYAREKGVVPLTSVADKDSVDLALKHKVCALKLSSEDLINLPLLEYVSQKKVPLILSTGMASEEEIEDAVEILKKHKCTDVVFFHCTSQYPTPASEVNVLRLSALSKKTSAFVGFSDHSIGTTAAVMSIALGACIIEKHFTLDKNMHGPDHYLSMNPVEMKEFVDVIRDSEKMKGSCDFSISDFEEKSRSDFRRSIVAKHDLKAGEVLEKEMLHLKRPGTGIRWREIDNVVGKKLRVPVKKDEQIHYDLLEGVNDE